MRPRRRELVKAGGDEAMNQDSSGMSGPGDVVRLKRQCAFPPSLSFGCVFFVFFYSQTACDLGVMEVCFCNLLTAAHLELSYRFAVA